MRSKRADLPSIDQYPKAHTTTFYFYSGVLQFIDEEYEAATTNLTKSLQQCHKISKKNKEMILLYLIPAEFITKRRSPGKKIWSGFSNLAVLYEEMFDALFQGNIREFNKLLLERRRLFVVKFLYLAMEKIQNLIYTRLFKKVYLVLDKPTRLPIESLSKALEFAGDKTQDSSSDQVECYLTDMIYSGRMKGYISRERQTLVLSSKEAFPKVFKK